MNILDFALSAFIILETLNVLALYFNPTLKEANGVGVFKEWENSKKQPANFRLMSYLVNWVAGTKAIFLALLITILIFGDDTLKYIATGALAVSISLFYWRMYPIIKEMDNRKELVNKGYSKTLAIMIGAIIVVLLTSLLFTIFI